jgi:three-Cys-motif partner protein
MDKKGNILEHSKIKLELYRLYLELYLTVILNSRRFSEVFIHDIFAGSGKSENNEKGSPLIAAVEIQKIRKKFPTTPVTLRLNEKCSEKFPRLQGALKPFTFVALSNLDANGYIQQWRLPNGSHNLFFVDPHGYTQISIDNLKRLFSTERSDFLIFIPIYHIYRFLRTGEDSEQLTSIANFLRDLNIGEKEAKNAVDLEAFAELVIDALRSISDTEWIYKEMIKNKQFNSQHCLIYITRNILGAQKFLEAQYQLKEQTKASQAQTEFAFLEDLDARSILPFIECGKPYDNVQLYEIGIKAGLLPKQLNKELKRLEENGKLVVTPCEGQNRKGKAYYIDYKYRTQDRKVSILFNEG